MDNDVIARRTARLTPAGREILAEIREAMDANDHARIPAIVGQMGDLAPADRGEVANLVGLMRRGFEAEASRLDA